jgi:hypothetical protein|tara:strand:+ start:61 stop:330 length:270 start_codon:yes stop_codon:yes gene_type:complete
MELETKRKVALVLGLTLITFIVFSVFRTGITTSAVYCPDCAEEQDCKDYCNDFCVKKAYDSVKTTGYVKEERIMCGCECESSLNNMITG